MHVKKGFVGSISVDVRIPEFVDLGTFAKKLRYGEFSLPRGKIPFEKLPPSYSGDFFKIAYRVRVKAYNSRGQDGNQEVEVRLVGHSDNPEERAHISRETNGFSMLDFVNKDDA